MTRVIVFVLFGGLLAASTAAPAPSTPPENDDLAWASYCEGVFYELKRQAIPVDNRTQFQDSDARISALQKFMKRVPPPEPKEVPKLGFWLEQGRRIAGSEVWDTLIGAGGQQFREMVMIQRSQQVRKCMDFADIYGSLANQLPPR